MMGKCVVLFLCFSCVSYVHSMVAPLPPPLCTANEEFTTKYMPQCEPTCENPNPGPCPHMGFQIGCICKSGYFRNYQGSCVTPWECYPNSYDPYYNPYNSYNQYPYDSNIYPAIINPVATPGGLYPYITPPITPGGPRPQLRPFVRPGRE